MGYIYIYSLKMYHVYIALKYTRDIHTHTCIYKYIYVCIYIYVYIHMYPFILTCMSQKCAPSVGPLAEAKTERLQKRIKAWSSQTEGVGVVWE